MKETAILAAVCTIAALALILLVGTAFAGDSPPWFSVPGPRSAIEGLMVTAAFAWDWRQSLTIADNPTKFHEEDACPLIGAHPTERQVNALFAANVLAYWAAMFILPEKAKAISG
jgi:hypothetical protein